MLTTPQLGSIAGSRGSPSMVALREYTILPTALPFWSSPASFLLLLMLLLSVLLLRWHVADVAIVAEVSVFAKFFIIILIPSSRLRTQAQERWRN
jgi:hypothetical protein